MSDNNIVLMPMCADLIHVGHINILNTGAEHGEVTVALMVRSLVGSSVTGPCHPTSPLTPTRTHTCAT